MNLTKITKIKKRKMGIIAEKRTNVLLNLRIITHFY